MDAVAIITAILSICISMLTLGWTIYRDVIQKPRFRVDVGLKSLMQAGRKPDGPHIFVEALNLGPTSNRVGFVFAQKSWWERKRRPKAAHVFIYPDFSHPAATPAGSRIKVGDKATFVIPYNKDSFLKEEFTQVGVADGFDRLHWASRKQLRDVRKKYLERFGS